MCTWPVSLRGSEMNAARFCLLFGVLQKLRHSVKIKKPTEEGLEHVKSNFRGTPFPSTQVLRGTSAPNFPFEHLWSRMLLPTFPLPAELCLVSSSGVLGFIALPDGIVMFFYTTDVVSLCIPSFVVVAFFINSSGLRPA